MGPMLSEFFKGKKDYYCKKPETGQIKGVLSQGMILAASDADADDRPYIPIVPEETPVGAVLR